MDSALGCKGTTDTGGFKPGTVTELAGQAGSGKTQLCLHLCATVQLPAVIGKWLILAKGRWPLDIYSRFLSSTDKFYTIF